MLTNIFNGSQHLKVHRLWPVARFFAKILAQLAGPSKRLLTRDGSVFGGVGVVVVVQVLLVGQVAELVGGGHLELVVLQRCQHQGGVL